MELTVNDNTYFTKLNIASQNKMFRPIVIRNELDIQLIITTDNQPVNLIIDAYTT